jgi:tetratricopeptide (TPR) repeat protein
MVDLWRILGYDEIANRIASGLEADDNLQVIEGPPGVGKSWLADGIGGEWAQQGGTTLEAEGDRGHGETDYYPFRGLANLSRTWSRVSPLAMGVVAVGETLLGTRGAIATTIGVLTQLARGRRRGRAAYLGETEQQILHKLEQLGRKRPILLIADNLHWWDEKSLDLLRRLRDPELLSTYPVLRAMRVIGVQSPSQGIANPRAHADLLAATRANHFSLGRIPAERFTAVLRSLADPEPVSADVADAVYKLSGGHLTLASRAVQYISRRGTEGLLSTSDPDGFTRALLVERVHSSGSLDADAMELLQVGATLGLEFPRSEIMCANPEPEQETSRLLRLCRDENLLIVSDTSCRFAHDLLHQFFKTIAADNKVTIHERLLECSRVLRPYDYDFRCFNALNAERPTEAGVFGVQAALERDREGQDWRTSLPGYALDAIEASGLQPVVVTLIDARQAMLRSQFQDSHVLLDSLPASLSRPLAAESDYIRALNLLSTRSEDDHAVGREHLAKWSDYLEDEPELGLRLMRLLLHGLAMLYDKGEAKSLESKIQTALSRRAGFDVHARDELHALDRCAGIMHVPEVALIRIRAAAKYFGPEAGAEVIRRPVEYYRCLVNLTATHISVAQYDNAAETYLRLLELLEMFDPGTFPLPEFAHTNGLLADYRRGVVDAAEALRRQREIVSRANANEDPYYVMNALAVYLTLAGEFDEALSIYDELDEFLTRSGPSAQASMRYMVLANRCLVRFLAGAPRDAVVGEWRALGQTVTEIAYTFRPYMERRHVLLAELLESGASMSARDLDEFLIRERPDEFGPLWGNFGRAFRMPEIEFWRD